MNDKPHLLTPTKKRPFPSVFYFLDTETTLEDIGHKTKLHSLKMGICQRFNRVSDYKIEFDREQVIINQSDFIQWLIPQIKAKSHSYIIAHNVVYDATILDLFRVFPKRGYKLVSVYSKGQVCIVRWSKGDRKITMLDNGNIFGGALERWGKILNIPKLNIDFETCTQSELITYCRRDVEIMVKAWSVWMEFIYLNECGGFRETVGSTAFNTWRHKFLKSDVYVHKDKAVLALERDGYHGGRVEAFFQGTLAGEPFYYLDINNMYGYVMQNSEFPVGLQGHTLSMGMKRMISYMQRYCVVARVTVNVDVPAFISRVNGFACYPLGRFQTVLTSNEIEYALEQGWIESVDEFAWYRKAELFKDYVNEYYQLRLHYRQAQNAGFEAICKLLINSLYGKFGQQGIEQSIIGTVPYNEVWHMPVIHAQTGRKGYQTALGGVIYEERQAGESFHSMPAIAAHVTANARLYLLTLLQQAGWSNVYYTDTDSLIVNQLGYERLENRINENVLGALKIETSSNWITINAPKDYEMEGRKKVKGVRVNALETSDGIYTQEQWTKLAGLIWQGFKQGYTSKEIVKHQQRIIHSGHVGIDGRISPFELE